MSWIKQKIKKIFYKEPNAKVPSKPIEVSTKLEKFDFKTWDGIFSDLSHWEEHFNIDAYDCPILLNKCTDGLDFVDNTHKPRKDACAKKGILYSGYHFFETAFDPIAQAEFYVKKHGDFTINPILDYETNGSQTEGDLKRHKNECYEFLCHVEKLTGKTPIIYTGLSLANYIAFDEKFSRFPLWIAAYRSKSNIPLTPKPWHDFFAWQFSESTIISGCGNSDASLYNKKMDLFNLKDKV
jgi:lysozyme